MKKLLLILMITFLTSSALAADDQTVIMNTKTYIYHTPDCKWAKKCTKNCIKITKQKAQAQGARACKVCGG
jgi:methylphosphotriester-DNA--protein-cysteine methyltransferase